MAAATSDARSVPAWRPSLRGVAVVTAVAIGVLALLPRWDDPPAARPSAPRMPVALVWSPRALGAIGSIRLGDPMSSVLRTLGPATSQLALGTGTRLQWSFEGGVDLAVETSGGSAPTALHLDVTVEEGVTGPSLAFGLTVGRSTIGDVVAHWGRPTSTGIPVASAVAYDTCVGITAVRVVLDGGDTDPHFNPTVRHAEVAVRGPFCSPTTMPNPGSAI